MELIPTATGPTREASSLLKNGDVPVHWALATEEAAARAMHIAVALKKVNNFFIGIYIYCLDAWSEHPPPEVTVSS